MKRILVGIAATIAATGLVVAPGSATAAQISIAPGVEIHASMVCTLGFVFDGPDGRLRGLSAGHCGNVEEPVKTPDGRVIGVIEAAEHAGTTYAKDTALIKFLPDVEVSKTILDLGQPATHLSQESVERANPVLCKLGGTTGLTCGEIVDDPNTPASMVAFTGGGRHGDSGSPVWTYGADGEILAVGTLSSTERGVTTNISYVEPVTEYISMWELH